jgi:Pseudouridylate synthases, 23S RNA-specific
MITLLNRLLEAYPNNSKSSLKKWVEQGRVLVDGVQAKRLDMTLPPEALVELSDKAPPKELGFPILFEDEHLIIVEKPSGLLSVATDHEKRKRLMLY